MASEEQRDRSPRPQFGNRKLTSNDDVFKHNAWDHVDWSEDQKLEADQKIQKHFEAFKKSLEEDSSSSVNVLEKGEEPFSVAWHKFYSNHNDKFFKDRHWLFTEFPELAKEDSKILEIGCGVGNTVIPVLEKNPTAFVYGCDYAESAIDILKNHSSLVEDENNINRHKVFVQDIRKKISPDIIPENSLDVIVSIFCLSALHPTQMPETVDHLLSLLKPGGIILFRDYGRYDMAQLRFKEKSCVGENLYRRGDGTLSYFFSEEDVEKLFADKCEKIQLMTDGRMQVNRARQLKMYRMWIQGKFVKK